MMHASFANEALAALGRLDPLEVMAATMRRIENIVLLNGDTEMATRCQSGWTVGETVSHLADSESVFAVRLRSMVLEHEPLLAGYSHDAWAVQFPPAGGSPFDVSNLFRLLRKANLTACCCLDAHQLARLGRHHSGGLVTVAELIAQRAGHDLLHLTEVAEALDRGSGKGHKVALRGDELDKANPMLPMAHEAKLIAFAGIDGSGKTSHALRLVDWLLAQGLSAHYQKNAGIRGEIDFLASAEGYGDGNELFGKETARLLGAVVRWKGMLAARPRLAQPGEWLVMDRYTYCEYAAVRQQGVPLEPLLRSMYRGLPRPGITFFLDTPPDVALARINSRDTDSEQLGFLRAFHNAYHTLPEMSEFVIVDGSQTFHDTQELIRAAVIRTFALASQVPSAGAR